ncbi:MAG: PTS transporter subunit EIIC [Halanaerobium sp.]|nr:PTS transporter subunit EIIC [Halanaerobium sp.]
MSDFTRLAREIMEACGGEKNIAGVNFCATRLRLRLKDPGRADEEEVKALQGVMGLVKRGAEYQVVIGTDVGNVYNEFIKLGDFKEGGQVDDAPEEKSLEESILASRGESTTVIGKVLDFISGTFVPVLPVLVAAGLVSAVLTILTQFFGLATDSGTYTVLNTINNAGFYFLPIYIGYSAARKIGLNPMMGAFLAGILIHQNIDGVAGLDFLGIPIMQTNYNTSVIPIILGVLFMYLVWKFADRISPKEIKYFSVPLITIIITAPVVLIALGPLGNIIGGYIATSLGWVNEQLGWLSVGIMGAVTPLLVMTGTNQALFPLVISAMSQFGYDAFVMPGMLAANVAVGGVAIAASILSRNKDTKAMSLSAGFTGILGITEPSIFGVCVRFRHALIGAMTGGAVGGLFAGIVKLKQFAIVSPGVAALPTFIPNSGGMSNFWFAIATVVIAFVVAFATTWILGINDEPLKDK